MSYASGDEFCYIEEKDGILVLSKTFKGRWVVSRVCCRELEGGSDKAEQRRRRRHLVMSYASGDEFCYIEEKDGILSSLAKRSKAAVTRRSSVEGGGTTMPEEKIVDTKKSHNS
ncbi:hypothetical protein Bca52824_080810 [Brassica carinata]|uniref:Uncharacterized protein n=1 Tax=Brassica carinata TaxID=52824 RepID=A0A8X7PJ99_BRACI|nr:hypothetical protein Bca52824_080810 [Brassica carinata]